jgi:hypothetical protein
VVTSQTNSVILESLVRWIDEQIQSRREGYDTYWGYYRGHQDVKLTERLATFMGQHKDQKFRDNFCEVVVDTLVDRLIVTGFISADDTVDDFTQKVWRDNRMDYHQTVVHTEAVMLGDSYVLVDWDTEQERPRFTTQPAGMIIPHYGEDSRAIDWASRKWVETLGFGSAAKMQTRLNLYYPDRTEKYLSQGNRWTEFKEPGDESWPLLWLTKDNQPLGQPMIHFANKPLTDNFGVSELINVVPVQDLLNKTLVDLAMGNDGAAFGRWWGLDLAGADASIKVTPGSISTFNSTEPGMGKLGAWDPPSVDGMLKTIELLIQHVAAITRTPQYLFQTMTTAPSGESLKVAESGLVDKAQRRQTNFGNNWEDAMDLARRVQDRFGQSVSGAEDATIETVWKDAERRNEAQIREDLAFKLESGVPVEQIWREMGYSSKEIDAFQVSKLADETRRGNVGAALLAQFNGGTEDNV